jgi:hypothetical protein
MNDTSRPGDAIRGLKIPAIKTPTGDPSIVNDSGTADGRRQHQEEVKRLDMVLAKTKRLTQELLAKNAQAKVQKPKPKACLPESAWKIQKPKPNTTPQTTSNRI